MNIEFDEESHTYTYDGVELISATTFIGKYFEPFRERFIAGLKAKKAKKEGTIGKTPAYWLKQWKESREHGTRTHKLIEDYINKGVVDLTDYEVRDARKYTQAVEYLWENEIGLKLITEKIIFSPDLGIAGTVDLVEVHSDGSISLHDWKTNNSIDKVAFKGKKAYDPISHIPSANFYKYQLQLQLYGFILQEVWGYKVHSLNLVHLKEDGYEHITIPVEFDDVKLILEDWLRKKR